MPNPNVIKIVDLGGGGDFSSTAAFVAWLYANYPTLDRNFCCICRSSNGNYADTSTWGSFPTVPANYIVLFRADSGDWFDGRFVSDRYHLMGNLSINITKSQVLAWYRIQFGRPEAPRAYSVWGLLFYCGVLSSALTAVISKRVHSSVVACSNSNPHLKGISVGQEDGIGPCHIYASLVINISGSELGKGIESSAGNGVITRIANTIIDGFLTAVDGDSYVETYYNATTCSSITPNTQGNRVSQTFTYVDKPNHNYILSWNDTGAKAYGSGFHGPGVITLNEVDPYSLRFISSGCSIGPTEPVPPEPIPWIEKTVNTDGGGDFSSLGAAFAWLRSNYPNLVTANRRVRLVCAGSSVDTSTGISGINTDIWRYIHIVARNDYYYKGDPNGTYYKYQPSVFLEQDRVVWEGIKVTRPVPWNNILKNCWSDLYGVSHNLWQGLFYCCLFQAAVWTGPINWWCVFVNSTIRYPNNNYNMGGPDWFPQENSIIVTPTAGSSYPFIALGIVRDGRNEVWGKYSFGGVNIGFRDRDNYDFRLAAGGDTALVDGKGFRTRKVSECEIDIEGYLRPFLVSYGMDEPVRGVPEQQCRAQVLVLGGWPVWVVCKATEQVLRVRFTSVVCKATDYVQRLPLFGRVLIKILKSVARVVKL